MSQGWPEVQKAVEALSEPVSALVAGFNQDYQQDDAAAVQAMQAGVALYDRSHWGRIEVSGDDRIRYLHNQSTNDFYALKPGDGCDTVFVTSTARTIDLVTAYVLDNTVLLLVSPNRRQKMLDWLDRYIFGADQVHLDDVTDRTATLSLMGPACTTLLETLTGQSWNHDSLGKHRLVQLAGLTVQVALGSGLATPGYTLICDRAAAPRLWNHLVDAGAVPVSDRLWEQLRIEEGRPLPETELTEDYNPLEAGLWTAISFSKGCYIGQETIARLNTYQGVKQQLWGIRLTASVSPGATITVANDKVGILTSISQNEQGFIGLAYVRTKAGGAGLKVQVGEEEGELVDVPFLTHSYV